MIAAKASPQLKPVAPGTFYSADVCQGVPGLSRALLLISVGLRNEGNREWNFTLRGMDDRALRAAAQLGCERELWDRCINTSERTKSVVDVTQRFPTPFRSAVVERANGIGLDPAYGAYVDHVPRFVRQPVAAFFANIDDLFSGINGVLQGPIGRGMLDLLPKYNLVGLGWLSVMERNVFSSKPIRSGSDMAGMKIRVMQSPGYVKAYESFGALRASPVGDGRVPPAHAPVASSARCSASSSARRAVTAVQAAALVESCGP